MIKVETSKLTHLELDWALAKALGRDPFVAHFGGHHVCEWIDGDLDVIDHTDPATCMGLTDQINIMQKATDGSWRVAGFCSKGKKHKAHGETLAEAASRLVVAMHCGDEVEIPDWLCQDEHDTQQSLARSVYA